MERVSKKVSALPVWGVLLLVWCLGWSGVAGAASVTVTPAGDNVYAVQGAGFSGVAGLDVSVTYDTSTLGNPRVVKGALIANSVFAANPNYAPGVIKIGAVSTSGFSGSGVIASITFDRKGESAGSITGLTASLINSAGGPLAVTTNYQNTPMADSSPVPPPTDTTPGTPTQPSSSTVVTAGGGGGGATGTPGVSTGGSVYLGSVSMPGDTAANQPEKKTETQKVDQPPPPSREEVEAPVTETARAEPEEKKAPVERKEMNYPSVSEKIRTAPGKLTMEKLLALFELPKGLPYTQTPGVVLSDGKTSVRLTLRLGDSKDTPSFALEHAKLLSLQQGESGEWLIEALPAPNINGAALTVSLESSTIRIPLTVAQPLAAKALGDLKEPSEKSFPVFLKERGTREAPRYDLNGDGKRDYLDDYIFAANFLVRRAQALPAAKRPAAAAPARPSAQPPGQ